MEINLDVIMPPILLHFKEQVMDVEPVGEGTSPWKYWEGPEPLAENLTRCRAFDIVIDDDNPAVRPNGIGAGTVDYDVPVYFEICYQNLKSQTAIAMRDMEEIRRKVWNSDTEDLVGYNFANFTGAIWIPSDDDGEFRMLRISTEVRVTVYNSIEQWQNSVEAEVIQNIPTP